MRRALLSTGLVVIVSACGGDDDGSTSVASTTVSTTDASSSSSSSTSSTSGSSSSGSTGAGSTSDGSTGGGATDPNYPAPDAGGMCPANFAVVMLPGSTGVCAPFCTGEGAMCPAPASGTAVGECTPFEQPGGSGDPCMTTADCGGGEACGVEGTCVSVAFWGCRLLCPGGTGCPDGMLCAAGEICGYT